MQLIFNVDVAYCTGLVCSQFLCILLIAYLCIINLFPDLIGRGMLIFYLPFYGSLAIILVYGFIYIWVLDNLMGHWSRVHRYDNFELL